MRRPRIGNIDLLAVDRYLAGCGPVKAHHAFDQRRLSGTVLAEKHMEGSGGDGDRGIEQRIKIAEAHGHAMGRDGKRAIGDAVVLRRNLHDSTLTSLSLSETEPNTPPCIFTILIAAA